MCIVKIQNFWDVIIYNKIVKIQGFVNLNDENSPNKMYVNYVFANTGTYVWYFVKLKAWIV